ncbi:hypothetical protein D9757_006373 [Collybiopsis confluens]|uniref:U three protein 23 n=1 Tax=Collybiopsis confluens TaxID=2823264 RepID=A0A8H5HGJ2_9AGAR|nr:hypothetical protein D9757_006373 [Collybiopsis confluens]
MRQKRAKTYRRLMGLYSLSFAFRQPYQALVDSEFCKAADTQKIVLLKQLETVLQGTVKIMITQCCIHELYLQRDQQSAVDLAKTFERRKCNHREAISGDDCLASVVGDSNKHRYVIATQSTPLRSKLRIIPAVPIVHINRSVMILEPPSDVTLRAKALKEQQALDSTTPDEKALLASSRSAPDQPKKRGPKGPNPLSVKKKKHAPDLQGTKERHAITPGKRKRSDGGEEGGPPPFNQRPDSESTTASRKRKRRKKAF